MGKCAKGLLGLLLTLPASCALQASAAVVDNLAFSTVDTSLASAYARSSIAIDASGGFHLAYIDVAASDIRYATQQDGPWAVETLADGNALDTPNFVARPSLALDASGRPCVLYAESREAASALVLAARDEGQWSFDTVVSGNEPIWDYSLAFDVGGHPHVCYAVWTGAGMDLHHGVRTNSAWTDTVIGSGDQPALAVDADGWPHVLYRGWDGAVLASLRLTRMTADGWTTEELPFGTGSWPELALDDAGMAHASYKSGTSVFYATNRQGGWSTTLVGGTYTDERGAALGLDWQDLPVLVFPDTYHRLVLAVYAGGAWQSGLVTDEGAAVYGWTPSCAFDQGVRLRLAFGDAAGMRFAGAQQIENGCAYAVAMPASGTVHGSTNGWGAFFTSYADAGWNESGSEQVWTLSVLDARFVTVTLSPADDSELDLFVLRACDPASCIAYGDTATTVLLEPGTWYVIVDGRDGAAGDYVLASTVSDPVGIDWCNLAGPPSLSTTVGTPSEAAYGRVYVNGLTGRVGPTAGLVAELGYGAPGSDPADPNPDGWQWTPAEYWLDADDCDEFEGRITPWSTGTYDYCFRYSYQNSPWVYGDLDGSTNGYSPEQAGSLQVGEPTDVPGAVPAALRLHPVVPNPFNPMTTLHFDLPGGGRVRLEVYDVAGRLVRAILDADFPAGSHQAAWDGADSAGRGMPSGSYSARLRAGGKVETVRMGLVR